MDKAVKIGVSKQDALEVIAVCVAADERLESTFANLYLFLIPKLYIFIFVCECHVLYFSVKFLDHVTDF